MKDNKLSNFEMCTLAIVGALQFAEQLRRAGKDLTRPAQKKEEKPKPIMKVGKIYELMNGKRACCVMQNNEWEFVSVVIGDGTNLLSNKFGKCLFAEANFGREVEFNVRRTWKKKYEKQKDVE